MPNTLDGLMASWDMRAVEHVAVLASPTTAWSAIRGGDVSRIPFVRMLLASRLISDRALGEKPGCELAFGAVARVRSSGLEAVEVGREAFASFETKGAVKIAWSLAVAPRPGGAWITADVRAVTSDVRTLTRYRHRWSFTRRLPYVMCATLAEQLGRAASDESLPLAGDDLLPRARAQVTHHVDIEAPPRDVWPWLVQMGRRRGGWYSWDRLDNGGMPSADRIIPAFQRLAVGDQLPVKASGPDGFAVLALEPARALVLGDPSLLPGRPSPTGAAPRATWAFSLEPIGDTATHLVVRVRADYEPSLGIALLRPAVVGLHELMERKQLRTLKQRAEAR